MRDVSQHSLSIDFYSKLDQVKLKGKWLLLHSLSVELRFDFFHFEILDIEKIRKESFKIIKTPAALSE